SRSAAAARPVAAIASARSGAGCGTQPHPQAADLDAIDRASGALDLKRPRYPPRMGGAIALHSEGCRGPDSLARAAMIRWPGSIRGRLLAALVVVVFIATAVLAVGLAVMLRAERDFHALAQDRIPAVALAGELAEATGQLATLAMQLAADPSMPAMPMKRAIDH